MGRKVYGVDLEESPFGGLIRKLLTEEELDMIADGGTAAGRGPVPDGGGGEDDEDGDETTSDGVTGTGDSDESDAGDDSDSVDGDTDAGSVDGDTDAGSDDADTDDWNVSDETYGSSGEADEDDDTDEGDDGASPTGAELSDSLGSGSSPPPSTAPDDRAGGYGAAGSSGYGGSTDFGGSDFGEFDDDYEDEEASGVGGFLAAHKWLLLKVAVGLAALAAVAVVVWRYKDKLAGAVPGRGGEDADEEFDVEAGDGPASDDVSPARRRAKGDDAGETPPPDGRDGADTGGDERAAPGAETGAGPGTRPPRDRTEDAGSLGEDVDMGALVGLGTLAVIAALVRKFDEERNRPHDPLVDGPLDEDEADVADDDQ